MIIVSVSVTKRIKTYSDFVFLFPRINYTPLIFLLFLGTKRMKH